MENNKRSKNWNLTINGGYNIEEVKQYLETNINCKYYMIQHDENEEQLHIHLVIMFKNQLTFNSIRNQFLVYKPHIEPVIHLNKSIQYLIHKNNKEKKQYNEEQIITNDTQIKKYLSNNDKVYEEDEQQLINDILNGKYDNIGHLLYSQDYTLIFIQRRLQVIKELFNYRNYGLYKKQENNNIIETLSKFNAEVEETIKTQDLTLYDEETKLPF